MSNMQVIFGFATRVNMLSNSLEIFDFLIEISDLLELYTSIGDFTKRVRVNHNAWPQLSNFSPRMESRYEN